MVTHGQLISSAAMTKIMEGLPTIIIILLVDSISRDGPHCLYRVYFRGGARGAGGLLPPLRIGLPP